MRLRNQRGCLRCTRRKTGPSCWEFLWRENDSAGNRTRRTAVIGTAEQFPTRDLAQVAVNGLRMCINQDRNRQREQSVVVADLVDHYIRTELSDEADWHSHATRIVYSEFLKRWIRPHWAVVDIRDVRTVAVERWLKQLRRVNGQRLADATKAKIRNLMSVLFNSPWQNYSKIAGGDQVCGKATMVPSAGQQREGAAGSAKRPSPGTLASAKVGKTPAQHGFSARAACPHPATCAGSGSG
jgi:hypothetical protein